MAKWLEQVSHAVTWNMNEYEYDMKYCHNLKVMGSNPGQVEFGVSSVSVSKLYLNQKFWTYFFSSYGVANTGI